LAPESQLGDDDLDLSRIQRNIHHAPHPMVPVLDLCVCGGGGEAARVRSHMIIAQQVVGNQWHELTKVGVHVLCKANQ
jgi:hypothetical protein